MKDRFDFIEDGKKPHVIEETEPLEEKVNYPVLARYDFQGNGPRPGYRSDAHIYQEAALLKTRGEIVSPIILRVGWILIRLAIGFAILYLFVHGRTFSCMGEMYCSGDGFVYGATGILGVN